MRTWGELTPKQREKFLDVLHQMRRVFDKAVGEDAAVVTLSVYVDGTDAQDVVEAADAVIYELEAR